MATQSGNIFDRFLTGIEVQFVRTMSNGLEVSGQRLVVPSGGSGA